ncbi:MAG: hypothetical protein R3296_10020 [Oleiphilaceae bacterium]|nr:hypothetical protein [Oleiphilaceae bacterium]
MKFQVRPAEAGDNEKILRLLANNPQSGSVSLAFERSPDYFNGAHVSCEHPDVYVLTPQPGQGQAEDRILGIFNIGHRRLYVDGQPRKVHYVHDVRLEPDVRGGEALMACYDEAREQLCHDDLAQTVVLSDNIPVLRAISKKREGLPDIFSTADIETSLISGLNTQARGCSGLHIRQANRLDIPRMQALVEEEGARRQFFPCYDFQALLSGDPYYFGLRVEDYWLAFDGEALKGMVAVWDQKEIRQTRVVRYSPMIALARPFYNLWCRFSGAMQLPPSGQCFDYLMLHTVLIRDHEPLVLRDLLGHLQQRYRRDYHAMVCGLCTVDPLREALKGFTRRTLMSYQFLGDWHGRDPRENLDSHRIPFAEVARL